AVNGIERPGRSVSTEPVPIWQLEVYCGAPFTHDGLADGLASTPGASLIVTVEGVPALVSSVAVVVYVGSPPAGKPVGDVMANDWAARAGAAASTVTAHETTRVISRAQRIPSSPDRG